MSKSASILNRSREMLQRHAAAPEGENGQGKSATPAPEPSERGPDALMAGEWAEPPALDGEPRAGDILALDSGEIVLFRQKASNQRDDFVYVLRPGGVLEPEGRAAAVDATRRLGSVEGSLFREMYRRRSWHRDAIIRHLDHWTFGRFIPSANGVAKAVSASAPTSSPASSEDLSSVGYRPKNESGALRRGVPLTIRMNGYKWEAVYWGESGDGAVVAARVDNEWTLQYLDLERFADRMTLGAPLSDNRVREIAARLGE